MDAMAADRTVALMKVRRLLMEAPWTMGNPVICLVAVQRQIKELAVTAEYVRLRRAPDASSAAVDTGKWAMT